MHQKGITIILTHKAQTKYLLMDFQLYLHLLQFHIKICNYRNNVCHLVFGIVALWSSSLLAAICRRKARLSCNFIKIPHIPIMLESCIGTWMKTSACPPISFHIRIHWSWYDFSPRWCFVYFSRLNLFSSAIIA